MSLRFTVITPSYNQGKFLEETILSVAGQEYKNIEHFVIDGESRDNSVEIIKRHENKLAWWVSEKDNGQTHAINKGLKKSTGDIIIWLNSDDVLLPGAIKKAATFFKENPKADFIHGKSILFGEGKKDKVIGQRKKDFKVRYLAYIPFPQPSSFFRKNIIDETGLLDESLHFGMDYELLVRTALSYNIQFCDEIFSKYRLHPDSKTNHQLKFSKEWNIIFSRVLNSFDGTEKLIEKFRQLGFYTENQRKYEVNNKFSYYQIEKSFLYHLLITMHIHYDNLELKKVKEISSTIKSVSSTFYKQHQIGSIKLRSTLLKRNLISMMRILTSR